MLVAVATLAGAGAVAAATDDAPLLIEVGDVARARSLCSSLRITRRAPARFRLFMCRWFGSSGACRVQNETPARGRLH